MFLAVAEAYFVDQCRREDVCIADGYPVYIPLLCAVAIAAAIGDPSKRRGHVLRVVNVAVASEHLVLFIEMLVDADVERSLSCGIDGRGLVVVFHPGYVLCRKELEKLDGIGVQTA